MDAQWRASKLKYFLYRRALQQVFDYIQDYNRRTGRQVRCYVPTHSLLNYAHWRIVSPESSLARLTGCDGYIAQVWTGTSRTPNVYRGRLRERTFETAFLEYGAMQNLVRSTGRTVWYLNDPIEDNPNHDWEDYRVNWESTVVASLLQPDDWQYEVTPWPERVFGGRYPPCAGRSRAAAIHQMPRQGWKRSRPRVEAIAAILDPAADDIALEQQPQLELGRRGAWVSMIEDVRDQLVQRQMEEAAGPAQRTVRRDNDARVDGDGLEAIPPMREA